MKLAIYITVCAVHMNSNQEIRNSLVAHNNH